MSLFSLSVSPEDVVGAERHSIRKGAVLDSQTGDTTRHSAGEEVSIAVGAAFFLFLYSPGIFSILCPNWCWV